MVFVFFYLIFIFNIENVGEISEWTGNLRRKTVVFLAQYKQRKTSMKGQNIHYDRTFKLLKDMSLF